MFRNESSSIFISENSTFPSKKFKYLKMVIYILKIFQKNLFPVFGSTNGILEPCLGCEETATMLSLVGP